MSMDHHEASELLGPHVRGELDAPTERRLSEHLETCAECRTEERGLRAVLAEPAARLTDLERASLHRHVRSELQVPASTPGRRLAWLPPALSTAALLLVVVVGLQVFGGADDMGEGDGAGSESQEEVAEGPQPITFTLTERSLDDPGELELPGSTGEGSGLEAGVDAGRADEGGTAEDEASGSSEAAAPAQSMAPGKNPGAQWRFTRYARSGKTFVSFAEAYRAEDVDLLRDAFTARLAAEAPPEARAQLVRCADLVVESRPYPTLPAAAAHGKYQGTDSMLLGFVWTRERTGPLDNYMLFVWPHGTCETPSHSQIGRVRLPRG